MKLEEEGPLRVLCHDMEADVLIIGGGIAGVSAAARLAALGSVLLLEAETALGHHASGRSAAMYEPYYGKPAVVALSLASGDYLRGVAGMLTPRGMMVLARAGEAAALAGEAVAQRMDVITAAEARRLVPILGEAVVAAAYGAQAWDIDTDLLLQGFARTARGLGARIVLGARVKGIARVAGGWRVVTAAGEYTARIIVNAAGAWVDEVALLAGVAPLGFTPLRRSMARIPAPGGLDVSAWPMMFGVGETWYAKPDAGALIVSPAEEHPLPPQDAYADDMVLAEGLARYEAMVSEPVTRLLANWAGLRTFSPDRVLVIGRDVAEPDFFWLAGQGGYGFQSSAAASQLAADLIGGAALRLPLELVAQLDPARFG